MGKVANRSIAMRTGLAMRVDCNKAKAMKKPRGMRIAIPITDVLTLVQIASTSPRLPSTELQCLRVSSGTIREPVQKGDTET